MHALLIPVGSAGDVHPFVGLARRLKQDGHRVTVVTNGHFGPLIRKHGLEFVEFGTEEEYLEVNRNPDLWRATKGFPLIARMAILGPMRRLFELVRDLRVPGETVVATSVLGVGARIAHDALGVPLATIQLQPGTFRSVIDPPLLPGLPHWTAHLPPLGWNLLYRVVDALVGDPLLAKGINEFRAELGLPPVRRVMDNWWLSPQLLLGLFPPWYATPAPDWPPQTRLTGFPLYDESDTRPPDRELNEFLDAGEPPIVFTPGSAHGCATEFFREAVAVCRGLGRRGVLLTRFEDQVPERLPDSIRHFHYVPFSQIFPRASLLVHHGGIGTTAQALASGVPQLVVPFNFDQPDNAARLERLEVARVLPAPRFQADRAIRLLQSWMDTAEVKARCKELAERTRSGDPVGEACRALESLVGAEQLAA